MCSVVSIQQCNDVTDGLFGLCLYGGFHCMWREFMFYSNINMVILYPGILALILNIPILQGLAVGIDKIIVLFIGLVLM